MSKRLRDPAGGSGDDDALSMLLQVLYQAAVARKALLSQLDSLNDCLRATDLIFQKLSTTHEAVLSSISDLRSEQEILRELRKRARTAALTTGCVHSPAHTRTARSPLASSRLLSLACGRRRDGHVEIYTHSMRSSPCVYCVPLSMQCGRRGRCRRSGE